MKPPVHKGLPWQRWALPCHSLDQASADPLQISFALTLTSPPSNTAPALQFGVEEIHGELAHITPGAQALCVQGWSSTAGLRHFVLACVPSQSVSSLHAHTRMHARTHALSTHLEGLGLVVDAEGHTLTHTKTHAHIHTHAHPLPKAEAERLTQELAAAKDTVRNESRALKVRYLPLRSVGRGRGSQGQH